MNLSAMTATPATGDESYLDDAALLARTVRPYAAKGAVYLTAAQVNSVDGEVVTEGSLGIAESCYIDDTGHFNAAEFVISYNQMIYLTLATAVRDRLIPELAGWTMDDYWRRQLPNVLITRMTTRFRRPIEPSAYRGRLVVTDTAFRNRSQPVIGLQTTITFTDDHGGAAFGDVEIALTDPPLTSWSTDADR
ncbi:fatty acyl CoA thioesterase FcoT [Gordonia sinesedis]